MHAPAMNSDVSALRFFFTTTLDRPDLSRKLIRVSISTHASDGAQPRGGAALKVGDIDSQRMLIRVERSTSGPWDRYRFRMFGLTLDQRLGGRSGLASPRSEMPQTPVGYDGE